MFLQHIHTAPFSEHPVVDFTQCEPQEFDIFSADEKIPHNFIIKNQFCIKCYCAVLLQKLCSLPKSKIKPFIQYQTTKINDAFTWLNKLEKLIDLNRDLFTTQEQKIKIEKALMIIELVRDDIEEAKNKKQKRRFDFLSVKEKLKQYPSSEEKLSLLYEAQTEYLQNKPRYTNPNDITFNEKIELEIALIQKQQQLNVHRTQLFSATGSPKNQSIPNKIKLNCKLNQLVDIFYQLMFEKNINDKYWIETTPNIIAELIANNFTDKNGHDISIDTVKTILKPSRIEKRPKGTERFNISD